MKYKLLECLKIDRIVCSLDLYNSCTLVCMIVANDEG